MQQPSASGEFDIDRVLRERCNKHGQSWSSLNVSEEIVGTLSRRNPDARCLVWKIIVCSHLNNPGEDKLGQRNQIAHLTAGSWLLSKFMPSSKTENDEGLVLSSAGLSTWRKCIRGQSGMDMTCCWSVVRNANFNNLAETVFGASAVLFLASQRIPWKLQKDKLHELLMSIPSGSCLPLLILSDSYKDEVSDLSSIIVNELGLHDLDKSQISSFLIVFLVENQLVNGFFSDKRLREGLQWLASESPQQLVLHHVKTRELVLTHLNSSFEVLMQRRDYEIDPNDLVLAYNEALDQALKKISIAAKENLISWPCPEISLLEFCNEYRIIENYVPKIGWSSVDKIEPLISALEECKLPAFPEVLSCLVSGSNSAKEIKKQLVKLEDSLIKYLTQASKTMGIEFAVKEAHLMMQRSSRLELHGSCFRIVPNWVMIFRRISNWRLMGIASGAFSSAYILDCHNLSSDCSNLAELGFEGTHSPFYMSHPSLDEMIQVAFIPTISRGDQPLSESNGEVYEAAKTRGLMEDESSLEKNGEIAVADSATDVNGGLGCSDNLSILLDKCEELQNMIGEKLSIYF